MKNKGKDKKPSKRRFNLASSLYPRFAIFISGVSLGACVIVLLLGWLSIVFNIFYIPNDRASVISLIIFLLMSATFAIIFSCLLGRRVFKSILEVSKAMQRVGEGDFSVRVSSHGGESELDRISKSFNLMVEELEKNEMLKSDFITNVSHEFKTPLAAIQNCASLLDDDSLSSDERSEYGKMLRESTDHLLTMCTNILRLSKIESSAILSDKSVFSLDEQIRLSILMLENKWTEKNIELNIELEETSIFASKELLSQVWLNIIGNAIKFTDTNGYVSIILKRQKDIAEVTVKDNGIGMDKESVLRIFDKFYQGDTSRRSEGNGLGLALVHKIVMLHSGKISVSSEPGKGSVFTVSIPLGNT